MKSCFIKPILGNCYGPGFPHGRARHYNLDTQEQQDEAIQILPGSNGHSICVFEEFDTTSPQREVMLARLVNMRKDVVQALFQAMSVGVNCGPDAHLDKQTDRMKGQGSMIEDLIDEIMKLYRKPNAFANDPIDWNDNAIKSKLTCLPRVGDEMYITGFKTI